MNSLPKSNISKFLILFVSFFIVSNSFANNYKTEGHYVGLDLVQTDLKFYEKHTQKYLGNNIYTRELQRENTDYGFGLNYRYAFNFDGFFITPGFFYERNDTKAKDTIATYGSLKRVVIDDRYGFKTDFGYDVHRFFSPYLSAGIARINYTAGNFATSSGNLIDTSSNNDSTNDWFYGAGIKSAISKDFNITLEYNVHRFDVQTYLNNSSITNQLGFDYTYNGVFDVKLKIIKVGLSYNF